MQSEVQIGVDVGGTNTDAAILHNRTVIGFAKTYTTQDVTSGVSEALSLAIDDAKAKGHTFTVSQVNIGTTHFVNAVIQRHSLARVAVIRLCGTASHALPPFSDFPPGLSQVVQSDIYMLNGGYQFDGTEISPLDYDEIKQCARDLKSKQIKHVVISGIFCSINAQQEEKTAEILHETHPELSITKSHMVGKLGILERESAAILNESLKPLCRKTIAAFDSALQNLGLTCPFFLTQNDGTIISSALCMDYPVMTFSSGTTNSMRGATHLSGVKDAVVIDIGGTSTDVGVIKNGFPTESSSYVKIGGVRTNFRMPDVFSFGLGGGSKVKVDKEFVQIGPQSVGYNLKSEGILFGGSILTATDIAVANDLLTLGDVTKVKATVNDVTAKQCLDKIHSMLEEAIDQVKTSADDVTLVLVGGGSVLVDTTRSIQGCNNILKPPHFQVANAIGAALSQVSGSVDTVVNLASTTRDEAIAQAKQQARDLAVQAGAETNTIQICEVDEIGLAYLPGNATRIKVKAVGNLRANNKPPKQPKNSQDDQVPSVDLKTDSSYKTKEEPGGDIPATQQSYDEQLNPTIEHINILDYSPRINAAGEWVLSELDVECICIGAGILGCGGGGNPHMGKLRSLKALKDGKTIRVISPERCVSLMTEKSLVTTVAFMGAPVILIEKLVQGGETCASISAMLDVYNKGVKCPETDIKSNETGVRYIDDYKPDDMIELKTGSTGDIVALMAAEIGGVNSTEPLIIGAELDIPVVDCDGMGRAFPEVQMFTPTIYGMPCYPATLADDKGQRAVIIEAPSPKHVEDHFRGVCVAMGCSAGFAFTPLKKEDVLHKTVQHSTSRAWGLGHAVLKARAQKKDPFQAILDFENGKSLCKGKIIDVERRNEGGFSRGVLKIQGLAEFQDEILVIKFQNENLVATMQHPNGQKEVLVCTPDLICIVDTETGEPIMTEEVRYGLRVSVLGIPAHPLLLTEQALKYMGPQAFGYSKEEVEFKPIGDYKDHGSVAPVSVDSCTS